MLTFVLFLKVDYFFFLLQTANKNTAKVPPPVPSKPKQINLPYYSQAPQPAAADTKTDIAPPKPTSAYTANKQKLSVQQRLSVPSIQELPPPPKLDNPPAVAVRPFTPQPVKDPPVPQFNKPQMVAASSIYSMYTKQQTPGKNYSVQGALGRAQTRPQFSSGKNRIHLQSSVAGAQSGTADLGCSVAL